LTISAPDARSPAIELAPGDRVCLIAGSGRLPVNVAAGLKAMGHPPFVIVAGGEKANLDELGTYDHTTVALERMADIGPLLRRERITHIVLAGGIGRRPRLTSLRPSWALIRMIGRLLPALGKGDNALLSIAIGLFEEHGYKVVGPHQLVPDLLISEGAVTRAKPAASDQRDLDAAFAAAKAIGALDIGQAAVAIGGRVVAVEGIEGTDGLLSRVKSLREHPRLAARRRGVLVKCAKPGQELRADLPSIGPQTVTAAHEAGLVGIGVEAGRSIVLDHDRVASLADELGLFVIGMPAGQP
jgi:UDP-2,3-diacylglucosamine hydrolase